jgi:hypothetical protein
LYCLCFCFCFCCATLKCYYCFSLLFLIISAEKSLRSCLVVYNLIIPFPVSFLLTYCPSASNILLSHLRCTCYTSVNAHHNKVTILLFYCPLSYILCFFAIPLGDPSGSITFHQRHSTSKDHSKLPDPVCHCTLAITRNHKWIRLWSLSTVGYIWSYPTSRLILAFVPVVYRSTLLPLDDDELLYLLEPLVLFKGDPSARCQNLRILAERYTCQR